MIYVVLIFLFFLLFVYEYKSRQKVTYTFWIGTFLFLALFAFRGDNVGGDTSEYCIYFEGKTSTTYGSLKLNDDIEIGFRWICMALQKISLSHFWFLFSTSLISLVPFVLLLKKYSSFPNLSYLYVSCSFTMIVCLETHIRQNIATAFIMMALYLLLNAQNKKNIIISAVLIAAGILTHTSIYLIFPLLLLLYFVKLTKKASYILVIGSCLVTLFFTDFFSQMFTGLMMLISPYETFSNLTRYMDSDKYGLSGKAGLFVSFLPTALWALINIYYASKDELNNMFMKCLIVGTSVTIMASSFGMSFRMMYALVLLGYCYIPMAYKKNTKAMLINLIPILMLTYRFIMYTKSTAQINTEAHWLPYMFIFE